MYFLTLVEPIAGVPCTSRTRRPNVDYLPKAILEYVDKAEKPNAEVYSER